jgi:hypothetical protein
MTNVAIPGWNAMGLIPPIDTAKPAAFERSPYPVSLTDFVLRFGGTRERRDILRGFLAYRKALQNAGLTQGFQWLDGSFLENIELIESRPPKDIDVVTFYHLPAGKSQLDIVKQAPTLFPATALFRQQLKTTYHVDAFFQYLRVSPDILVTRSTYWYSMWSHRRTEVWKGFVQVSLASTDDQASLLELDNLDQQAVQP